MWLSIKFLINSYLKKAARLSYNVKKNLPREVQITDKPLF